MAISKVRQLLELPRWFSKMIASIESYKHCIKQTDFRALMMSRPSGSLRVTGSWPLCICWHSLGEVFIVPVLRTFRSSWLTQRSLGCNPVCSYIPFNKFFDLVKTLLVYAKIHIPIIYYTFETSCRFSLNTTAFRSDSMLSHGSTFKPYAFTDNSINYHY